MRRGAVFSHSGRCLRSQITYDAAIRRYLWWQQQPNVETPEAGADTRFEGDRAALIEQLRAEREQHARDAEAALAAAEAGDEPMSDEIVPGIRDPFKNTPSG